MINLINGDCLKEMKNIPDNSIDMILTDVPYDVSKKNNFKSIKNYTKKTEGDSEYNGIDFGEWDKNVFDLEKYIEELLRVMKNGTSAFIWCSHQQLQLIEEYYKKYCPKSKQGATRIGVWQKTNPSVFNMDKMPINPFEFGIWFRKGSKWTFNKREDGKATRLYWENSYAVGPHPTQKRVDICEDIIKTFSNEGDIIFDGVMGSGTTGVACKNLNRDFIGIELDEKYFEIAKNRIENYIII